MAFEDEDTLDLDLATQSTDQVVAETVVEAGIEIGAVTHRGKVRTTNQDQYAVVRRTRMGQVFATSLDAEDLHLVKPQHSWLLAVADGVGGHASGEVASATALHAILNFAFKLSSWVMLPITDLKDDSSDRVDLYAEAIQQELRQRAESNPELTGMATTVTAAYVFRSNAIVVNVGDSRSYLVRDNVISQITRDHSMARDLEDAGAPERMIRRYRNVLTRCFSTKSDRVRFDLFQLALNPKDQILLCSDGLSDMVADEDILRIVMAGLPVKDSSERLVTAALENGGKDNVTVVLARV